MAAHGSGGRGAGAIARLSDADAGRLRTLFIIGSLAQAVEELVHNALDAGARDVAVKLDAAGGAARCADDGAGVPAAQLANLGRRHHTSKLASLAQLDAGVPSLGFRGEALASIADTAVVEVLTRAEGEFDTSHLVLKGGAALACGLSPTPRTRGTTITLRAFMHNQPVRRNALSADPGGELERCRERLLRVALARPDIRLTLDSGTVADNASATPPRRVLDCAAGRTLAGTFAAAYGGVLGGGSGALATVALSRGALSLSGATAVPPHGGARTGEAAHLFLSGRALRRGAAHRLADAMFASATDAESAPEEQQLAAARPSRMAGRARGPGRHAAFALHLVVPTGFADVTSEADKTVAEFADWPAVLCLLAEALLAAWRDAGAPPAAVRAAARAAAAAGAVPQQLRTQQLPASPAQPRPERASPPPPLPLWVSAAKRPRADTTTGAEDDECAAGCCCPRSAPFSLDAWPRRRAGGSGGGAAVVAEAVPAAPVPPASVEAALAEWRNPAWPSRAAAVAAEEVATAAALSLAPTSLRAALLRAPPPLLLAQPASSFLLALCARDGVLLAVDPHAAHERVRLEALTAEALGPSGTAAAPRGVPSVPLLPPPPPLPLTAWEAAAARAHAPALAAWGWRLGNATDASSDVLSGACSVRVLAAPVVAGVPLQPADLAEFLRSLSAVGGAAGAMPPAAQRALASRACRGAVTLGTPLPAEHAEELLAALAETAQPLACAHGRPTAAPLAATRELMARMRQLEAAETAPRHRLSVARARALLHAAGPFERLFALDG